MTPELKKEWVDALRYGDYIQGRGSLKNISFYEKEETYCCLGVLMDISKKFIPASQELPTLKEVEEFGLSDKSARELARMNDSGYTFHEIANFIASNVES